jgi:alpha-amylase
VLNCDYLGLPDLNTEDPVVFQTQKKFLASLMKLGIAGFRIDAAINIPADYIQRLIQALYVEERRKPYIIQETVFNPAAKIGLPIPEYMINGKLTNFLFAQRIINTFKLPQEISLSQTIHELQQPLPFDVDFPSGKAVTFLANHDYERNPKRRFEFSDQNRDGDLYLRWMLANAFLLTWPYGTPIVLSSYHYTSKNEAAPNVPIWKDNQNRCFTEEFPWLCQHRQPGILALAGFHQQMQSANARNLCSVWSEGNVATYTLCDEKERQYGYVGINLGQYEIKQKIQLMLQASCYRVIAFQHGKLSDKTLDASLLSSSTLRLPPMSFTLISGC